MMTYRTRETATLEKIYLGSIISNQRQSFLNKQKIRSNSIYGGLLHSWIHGSLQKISEII